MLRIELLTLPTCRFSAVFRGPGGLARLIGRRPSAYYLFYLSNNQFTCSVHLPSVLLIRLRGQNPASRPRVVHAPPSERFEQLLWHHAPIHRPLRGDRRWKHSLYGADSTDTHGNMCALLHTYKLHRIIAHAAWLCARTVQQRRQRLWKWAVLAAWAAGCRPEGN
jgi:hypothetical protein